MQRRGFTLIELSIVLVIIGLIVGGIVVGRELISAAAIRSQVTQIQQIYTATNAFKMKYGALPGDMYNVRAASFGMVATNNGTVGLGDGNGFIGVTGLRTCTYNQGGEALMFWSHLNSAGLISGVGNMTDGSHWGDEINSDSSVDGVVPKAKIGNSGYIFVCSEFWGDPRPDCNSSLCFSIWGLRTFGSGDGGNLVGGGATGAGYAVSANQAYSIDVKMDDGLPRSGKVWGGPYTGYPLTSLNTSGNCITGASLIYTTSGANANTPNCVLNFIYR